MSDLLISCERCGQPKAKIAYGWTLLCKKCANDDQLEIEGNDSVSYQKVMIPYHIDTN